MPTQVDQSEQSAIVPRLGVGLLYQEELHHFIETHQSKLDFLEVIPDLFWTDLGPNQSVRYFENRPAMEALRKLQDNLAVVPHSIGLSIGSAHRFDREHVEQVARWSEKVRFPWHSDHLAFIVTEHGGGEINVGVTLPLPYDEASLDLLVPRIREVRARIPGPFLLENNVYFFNYPQQEMTEPAFLNELCERSGCALLLDLHNLYTNSRNHGRDPYEFLDALNLDNVLEIHVAGGIEYDGFYHDAHSGVCGQEVWQLLEWTLPRCRNLGGVVFELLGSWYVDVGEEQLLKQLSLMRSLWTLKKG